MSERSHSGSDALWSCSTMCMIDSPDTSDPVVSRQRRLDGVERDRPVGWSEDLEAVKS